MRGDEGWDTRSAPRPGTRPPTNVNSTTTAGEERSAEGGRPDGRDADWSERRAFADDEKDIEPGQGVVDYPPPNHLDGGRRGHPQYRDEGFDPADDVGPWSTPDHSEPRYEAHEGKTEGERDERWGDVGTADAFL